MEQSGLRRAYSLKVNHASELPFRTRRLEAVWSIESYSNKEDANQVLLELAILERDLRETSRWWRRVGLATKLLFARDRLIESFDWAVGVARDVHSINDLPDYMKLCFLALCNTINEIAYENLKEKEENFYRT
ncbi:hypothetical protein NC653_019455 [Populus alba x Populus x berolinensis]|uniref:Terpene synthase metal-binding domain-containing protein n=1 Tax=Populus alba x Populus x berolinensis TaxID=444605 RepID=A0AAD6QIY9_9ROSI|nr:hypothetical protein NC653_019455 [Populus alba x Populus x berolinensis]